MTKPRLAAVIATGAALTAVLGGAAAANATPFVLPLTIPPTLTSSHITIHMREAQVQLVPDGPPTTMWTYDGSFPGPTIRRPAGAPTWVTFVNNLPSDAGPMTVHFHGDHHPASEDGSPYENLIFAGQARKYTLPLIEDGGPERSAVKWYHDHRLGETSRNVWNGLAGMFIVDDALDQSLPLPKGQYDVPLMIADRSLLQDNSLADFFSNEDPNPLNNAIPQGNSPPGDASTGSTILVNGRQTPYFDVADRSYRFRIVNASNFTAYNLHLSNNADMVQVGADGGLLPAPVTRKTILLGPAERADIVVNFHGSEGSNVELDSVPRSDHPPAGGTGAANAPIMQFRVDKHAADTSSVPTRLRPLPAWTNAVSSVPSFVWSFGLGYGLNGAVWTINGKTMNPNRVDLQVPLGSTQTWLFTNTSNVTHYVHVHDVQFLELSRDGHPPDPWEAGLKDTFRVDPGEEVIVAAKFPDYTGRYMIHCHMLDHEDHGMMTQFEVVGSGGLGVPPDPGTSPPPSRGPTTALGLPSNKRCKSSERFVFQLRAPRHIKLTGARLYVNGHLIARLGRAQLAHRLSLTNLPRGHFTIKIVARTTRGKTLTASRRYAACHTRRSRRATDAAYTSSFECHLTVL